MVTCPSVVGLTRKEGDALHLCIADSGGKQFFHLLWFWMHDEQVLSGADGIGHLHVGLRDFVQYRLPVSVCMRPC